jgi:hypothetical protein
MDKDQLEYLQTQSLFMSILEHNLRKNLSMVLLNYLLEQLNNPELTRLSYVLSRYLRISFAIHERDSSEIYVRFRICDDDSEPLVILTPDNMTLSLFFNITYTSDILFNIDPTKAELIPGYVQAKTVFRKLIEAICTLDPELSIAMPTPIITTQLYSNTIN